MLYETMQGWTISTIGGGGGGCGKSISVKPKQFQPESERKKKNCASSKKNCYTFLNILCSSNHNRWIALNSKTQYFVAYLPSSIIISDKVNAPDMVQMPQTS